MQAKEYQEKTKLTAIYPKERALEYLSLGLVSESGEVAGKVKKIIRDNNMVIDEDKKKDIKPELGDVCWYISELCNLLGFTIEELFDCNIKKLLDRKERSVIGGSGDKR